MGADVLSIDGFECTCQIQRYSGIHDTDITVGAGHPGEDDIGGLVLVC